VDHHYLDSEEQPELGSFSAIGNYIDNYWKRRHPNGEKYLERIAAADPSDLFGRLLDQLQTRVLAGERQAANLHDWNPKVRLKEGAVTPEEARTKVLLDHYSDRPRSVIDPAYQGSAHAGAESAREDRIPRSYYYTSGTIPEPMFWRGHTKQTLSVKPTLYDIVGDPLGLKEKLAGEGLTGPAFTSALERAIAAHGFDGYASKERPSIVSLFRPVRAEKDGTGTLLGPDGQPLVPTTGKEPMKKAIRNRYAQGRPHKETGQGRRIILRKS